MQAKAKDILEFFSDLFYRHNASYSAINTARSALASVMSLDDSNYTIGSHPIISKYMKGVFQLRTPTPRYAQVWDVSIVLDYLRLQPANDKLPLCKLTQKLSMLLALTSAQRVQTLWNLNLDKMCLKTDSVEFHVDSLLKQSKPGNVGIMVKISAFLEDERLCAVHCIEQYIKLTKEIRKSERHLFISFRKPHKRASSQTISRWIRVVMKISGIDTDQYKSHSTRAASTSIAKKMHIPMDVILKHAGWANEKTFEKYYNKPVNTGHSTFTQAVLHH
ncbi:uncharacterized protein LOC105446791 [Strongylocentrotus purpuratus]|uniref:Tyr recombinase domain-containing protein n=1 Tax=Strongylocentrotus purpuratus TaxID=7668 RepID=A0A7M7HP24_STRPU|nr:uncharacterized protein LOC105446791 [Strongylocentrotus purpuratus]